MHIASRLVLVDVFTLQHQGQGLLGAHGDAGKGVGFFKGLERVEVVVAVGFIGRAAFRVAGELTNTVVPISTGGQ